jgi:hypothetical protein
VIYCIKQSYKANNEVDPNIKFKKCIGFQTLLALREIGKEFVEPSPHCMCMYINKIFISSSFFLRFNLGPKFHTIVFLSRISRHIRWYYCAKQTSAGQGLRVRKSVRWQYESLYLFCCMQLGVYCIVTDISSWSSLPKRERIPFCSWQILL